MPKKGKKSGKSNGKKGKSGKVGKKDGKGNKEGKQSKSENAVKLAIVNSNIWESRLEMLEKSKAEYRETANQLANQNSEMHDVLIKNEKDTIDVITYIKAQNSRKDDEIFQLKDNILELHSRHKREKQEIITDMSEHITKLEAEINEKNNEILVLKGELESINEFREKRNQLNSEFKELKDALYQSNKEHETVVGKLERKFLEEKMRIQVEANKKIAEMAEASHKEAIEKLDEATKSVFKENVRANEALKYHIKNTEKQREKVKKLKMSNQQLKADKEMLDLMVTEKVTENGKMKETIKELTSKVDLLEKALTQTVKEFDTSNRQLRLLHENEMETSKIELEKLTRLLNLRSKELKKIRFLAKQVLNDRSEIEKFFLDSLEMVKQEIRANQNQYTKDSKIAYQHKMMMAFNGKADYPLVRTFNKNSNSTNSVYTDLEAAMKLKMEQAIETFDTTGIIDIGDLTWEQRERVIRYLFTKINSSSGVKKPAESINVSGIVALPVETSLPQIPGTISTPPRQLLQEQLDDTGDIEDDEGFTFVTQGVN